MIRLDFWPLFVVCLLATWRLTHLLALEDGPFDIVLRLRSAAGNGVVGRMMDCFFCLSVWVAAPLALPLALDFKSWALQWLALSGGACLLHRISGGDAPSALSPNLPSKGVEHGMLWSGTGPSSGPDVNITSNPNPNPNPHSGGHSAHANGPDSGTGPGASAP